MSDTPKTDAMMTALLWRTGETLIADVEFANFARQLERENAVFRSLLIQAVERYVNPYSALTAKDYIARAKAALGEGQP